MKSIENTEKVKTIINDGCSTNGKKEEMAGNMDSFRGWVTTGSAWFQSAKEKVTYFVYLIYFMHIIVISIRQKQSEYHRMH